MKRAPEHHLCPKCKAYYHGGTTNGRGNELLCGRCYVPLVAAVRVNHRWVRA